MLGERHLPQSIWQIPLCVCCVVCVTYESVTLGRLSIALQTDRPELVNRCCWSSWGWGHGASPQSLIKEELSQPPVIPATWFMSLCQRALPVLAKTGDKVKVHRLLQGRSYNNMAKRSSHMLIHGCSFKVVFSCWSLLKPAFDMKRQLNCSVILTLCFYSTQFCKDIKHQLDYRVWKDENPSSLERQSRQIKLNNHQWFDAV